MQKYFLIPLALFLLACQTTQAISLLIVSPTSTATEPPTSTPHPLETPTSVPICGSSEFSGAIAASLARIEYYTIKFPTETQTTPYNSAKLTAALTELKAIRAKLDIPVPSCLNDVKAATLEWIDALVDLYSTFQKDKNATRFSEKWIALGSKADTAFSEMRTYIDSTGINPTPTPAAVIANTIKVIDWTWYKSPSGSYIYVDGQVQNISNKSLSFVRVNIALYDQNKSLLATDGAFIDATTLQPGQQSNFKVMTTLRPGMKSVSITGIEWR